MFLSCTQRRSARCIALLTCFGVVLTSLLITPVTSARRRVNALPQTQTPNGNPRKVAPPPPEKGPDAVLPLSANYDEAENAGRLLRKSSKRSKECRQKVIAAVMNAMGKNLDIREQQSSANLWREGAALLGDLKAAQALDLLLEHIDMDDGEFSMTMVHQPAISGIIRMGGIAIPKLRLLLRDNSNSAVRHDTVYCLAYIGGPSARGVLQEALPKESDPCVKRFINAAVEIIDSRSGASRVDRAEWAAAFLCKNR